MGFLAPNLIVMPYNNNTSAVIFESHEERLQTVESNQTELTAKIAEIANDQKHVVKALEDSTDRVVGEFEKLHSDLGKLHTDLKGFDSRLAPLERQETIRGNRYKWWIALATTAIGAFIGAVISKIVG